MVDGSVVLEVEGAEYIVHSSSCCCAVKEVSVWFIQIRHLCSRYNLLDPLQVLAAPPHQDLVVPAPPGSLQGSGPVEVSCLKNHRQ